MKQPSFTLTDSIHRQVIIMLAAFAVFCSCSEKEFDPNDPQKSYGIAKEPYDDEDYEIAITRLGEFKARFPYSKYVAEAELLIANCHFELDQFAEAAAAYEQFVKLHPRHPKVGFSRFRVGESHWADAPEEVDRDQELTIKAVEVWDRLAKEMPDSEYAPRAAKLVREGRRRVAESHEFIADFYCKLEIFHSCAYRFLKLIDDFPQFADLTQKARRMAALALDHVADRLDEDPESDANIYFKNMTSQEIRSKASQLRTAS